MEDRIGRILALAGSVLARQNQHKAADFLASVAQTKTERHHGDLVGLKAGTDIVTLFVPPERMADWGSVKSVILVALETVSMQVGGATISEVEAYAHIGSVDPRRRPVARGAMLPQTRARLTRILTAVGEEPNAAAWAVAAADGLDEPERSKFLDAVRIIFGG